MSTLKSLGLLSLEGKGFRVATGKTPTPQHDVLNCREIGKEVFDNYVNYSILRKPSVKALMRKRRLATLSDKNPTKSRLLKAEKDLKLVQKCLHKKLKWSKKTQKPVDVIAEQYIPLPLAIADNDGMPIKGNKSFTTKASKSRYRDSPVVTSQLPPGWTPDCCIIEGMFMLNTSPINGKLSVTMLNFK